MSSQETISPPQLPAAESLPQGGVANFRIFGGHSLFLANGLQPIAEKTLLIDGQPQDVDVVAALVIKDGNDEREGLLTRQTAEPDSPLVMSRVHREGENMVVDSSKVIDEQKGARFRIGKDQRKAIVLDPSAADHQGWFAIRGIGAVDFEITVAEAAHPVQETQYERRKNLNFKRHVKQAGAVALGMLAFKSGTMPGGLHDRIADGQQSAEQFVLKDGDTMRSQMDSLVDRRGGIDGHLITREEQVQDFKQANKEHLLALNRVARTMGDLDAHKAGKVIGRAETYEKQHAAELLPARELEDYQDQLQSTKTTDEALEVMSKFLNRYGVTPLVGENVSAKTASAEGFQSDLKFAGSKIMEVFGSLPDSVVKEAFGDKWAAPTITFAFGDTVSDRDDGIYGTEAAHFDGTDITLYTTARVAGVELANFKHILAHELSHGLFGNPLVESTEDTKYDNLITRAVNVASHIVGKPEFTSDYATSSSSEEAADSGSDILRGDIANPDDVLSFTSRSNATRLQIMVDLEERHPGISDYLVYKLRPDMLVSDK